VFSGHWRFRFKARCSNVDERVVCFIENPFDLERLENDRTTFAKNCFPLCLALNLTYGNRSGLPAGNGGVGWIFEPTAFLQSVNQSLLEIGKMAGGTRYFWVRNCFDYDVISEPINVDISNGVCDRNADAAYECKGAVQGNVFSHTNNRDAPPFGSAADITNLR
jgi:hypothetical protein